MIILSLMNTLSSNIKELKFNNLRNLTSVSYHTREDYFKL